MQMWVRVLCGVGGLALEIIVLDAAIRTFLLPRVARVRLSRMTSRVIGSVFRLIARRAGSYVGRDRVLSLFPSIVLLSYQALWLGMSLVAFALAFVASGAATFTAAFKMSGSSIFTLGSAPTSGPGMTVLGYVEAGVGLTLLALLIAFIPTLYSAFQRREFNVSQLSVRAGIPATPWGVVEIAHSVNSYDRLEEIFREWEQWFIDVGETHSTLTILNYYRSPDPNQTWVGAMATVLDAASLFNAAVDVTPSPAAGLCIRAGWLTLRRLANYFGIPYPMDLNRSVPIAISREEFDLVIARLERSGVPIVADHEAAWWDFVGWRVNYDAIIEACYGEFNCPRTDWHAAVTQPLFGPSNLRGVL